MNKIRVDKSWGGKMAFLIVVTMLLRIVSSHTVSNDFSEDLEEFERINSDDNGAGNRSLIITETMERYKRNRLFSRSMPCFSSFLQNRSITFWYSTSFIPSIFDYTERQIPVEIDLLVHTLQAETATNTVNNVHAIDHKENLTSTVIVIVIENLLALEKMNYTYYSMVCTFDCEYVVIMAKIFVDEEDFLREADILQKSMWSNYVGRLVILGSTGETVLLAGTRSFEPKGYCVPSAPILLGSCLTKSVSTVDKSTVWKLGTEPIDGRDLSMNGCMLIIAYYENSPYVHKGNKANGYVLAGLEIDIIKEILYGMNARLVTAAIDVATTVRIKDRNFTTVTNLFEKHFIRVQFILGGLVRNPYKGMDYTIAYSTSPVVWVTPVMSNFSLRGLVSPFSTLVWIVILCIIFAGILIMLFLINDISFLDIIALIIGTSVFRQPTLPSSRILFLCWCLFGFFTSQYYFASLADQLVNTSNLKIESVEELLSSGLELGGISQDADLFNEIDENDEDDEENLHDRRIRERLRVLPVEDYNHRVENLLLGKDQSMAMVVELSIYFSELIVRKQYVHILKENINSQSTAFATWVGFPCLRKFNRKMRQLLEGGIVDRWIQNLKEKSIYEFVNVTTTYDTNVHFKDLVPVFLVLIVGYLVAFCVFIIEIIAYPSKWLA